MYAALAARSPNAPHRSDAGTVDGASGAKRRIRALGWASHRLAVAFAGAADPRICAAAIDSAAVGLACAYGTVVKESEFARNETRGADRAEWSRRFLVPSGEAVRGGGSRWLVGRCDAAVSFVLGGDRGTWETGSGRRRVKGALSLPGLGRWAA